MTLRKYRFRKVAVPMLGQSGSVPIMGRVGGYLDWFGWHDSLTVEERIARGPFQSAFAVGRGEHGKGAIDRARRQAIIASHVLDQVREQAVFALLVEGYSLRDVAASTGLSKSEVGRIAKRFERDGDTWVSHPTLAPLGSENDVRNGIRAAWGHR